MTILKYISRTTNYNKKRSCNIRRRAQRS